MTYKRLKIGPISKIPAIANRRIRRNLFMGRENNLFVDVPATLTSMTKVDCGVDLYPLQIKAKDFPAYCTNIEDEPDG